MTAVLLSKKAAAFRLFASILFDPATLIGMVMSVLLLFYFYDHNTRALAVLELVSLNLPPQMEFVMVQIRCRCSNFHACEHFKDFPSSS